MEILIFIIVIFFIYLILNYFIRIKNAPRHRVEMNGSSTDKFLKNTEELIEANYIKLKKKAQIIISQSLLTDTNWILINSNNNIIYTFKSNNELLVTIGGNVERMNYELIVDNNTIIIGNKNSEKLYQIYHEKNNFIFLNLMFTNDVLLFANYTKFKDNLKSDLKLEAIKNYRKIKL